MLFALVGRKQKNIANLFCACTELNMTAAITVSQTIIWMTLHAERRRCWECTVQEKLLILFVLHVEFFSLKDAIVEVHVVDLKVPNVTV